MDNIAEGFDAGSDRHFANFLIHARGSLAEVRSKLWIVGEQDLMPRELALELRKRCEELSGQLTGFMRYLRLSDFSRHARCVRDSQTRRER